jgi:hypothetical protein
LPPFRPTDPVHPGTETPIALVAVPEKSSGSPLASNL